MRRETEYFADIPPMELPDEMVRITEHILETKQEDFNPAWLEDRYRTVLVLKRSLAAEQPETQPARTGEVESTPRRTAAPSKQARSKRSAARSRRSG